jgi:N-acetylmuramic acid 6-phosphate etherase
MHNAVPGFDLATHANPPFTIFAAAYANRSAPAAFLSESTAAKLEAMNLATLATEARNPLTEHIDELPTADMLRLINDEDAKITAAVAAIVPQIAQAIDAIVQRFNQGGRLFYIGAGTSGRLGVLDASECPPTFSVPPSLVQGIIAGGDSALRKSSEASEDSPEQGAADLVAAGFGTSIAPTSSTGESSPQDVPATLDTLVGIAASGRTPYVLGALAHARNLGALTIALTCVPNSAMAAAADISIAPIPGPEVITGSTRMKAGTATKLVLNMLSTGIMIKTGAVYGNLMVNVQPTNAKLVDRSQRIIMAAAQVDQPTAAALLNQAGSVKTAIVMQKLSLDRTAAEAKLASHQGRLAAALK